MPKITISKDEFARLRTFPFVQFKTLPTAGPEGVTCDLTTSTSVRLAERYPIEETLLARVQRLINS